MRRLKFHHTLLCLPLALSLTPLAARAGNAPGEGRSLPSFVADARHLRGEVEKVAPDALVESLPGGYVAVYLPEGAPQGVAQDARYKISCTRVAYVYAPRRETTVTRTDDGVGITVLVHYDEVDADWARRLTRLSARLLRLHRERFGHDAVFPRAAETADLWLAPPSAENPNLAGETRSASIYLWGIGKAAAPIESVRTLTHEWGHLTLPAARGYTSPESDASGYLGERLYLKWMYDEQVAQDKAALRSDAITTTLDDGTDRAGLETYYQRQIEPLLTRFAEDGPDAEKMNGLDTEAMDAYIASALGWDQAFGSRMLGMALYSIDGTLAHDFVRAMQDVVSRSDRFSVRLPAWVPLTKGRYTVVADGVGEMSVSGRAIPVRPAADLPLPVKISGWKKITCPLGAVRAVTIRQMTPSE